MLNIGRFMNRTRNIENEIENVLSNLNRYYQHLKIVPGLGIIEHTRLFIDLDERQALFSFMIRNSSTVYFFKRELGCGLVTLNPGNYCMRVVNDDRTIFYCEDNREEVVAPFYRELASELTLEDFASYEHRESARRDNYFVGHDFVMPFIDHLPMRVQWEDSCTEYKPSKENDEKTLMEYGKKYASMCDKYTSLETISHQVLMRMLSIATENNDNELKRFVEFNQERIDELCD